MKEYWHRFIHWSGWTQWLHWKIWKSIGCWNGWKKIFCLNGWLTVLLSFLCALGLCWVFLTGRENGVFAYPIYCLSFYTLVVVCVRLPALVRWANGIIHGNPYAQRYLTDSALRFRLSLYLELVINLGYGLFKTVFGVLTGSAWNGADGLYNLAQGMIQFIQVLRRRKELPMLAQWKSYRLCGWLILLMHLTMTGPVYQVTQLGAFEEYPGYFILVSAMFTFYKLIHCFIDVAKDRKHKAPIDSSVRLLNLSQAFFSMFSLQVAMIHQFGGEADFAKTINTITGSVVCLLVASMGIYMLRRARRSIKHLEETSHG